MTWMCLYGAGEFTKYRERSSVANDISVEDRHPKCRKYQNWIYTDLEVEPAVIGKC